MSGLDLVVEEIIEKAIKGFDGKVELGSPFEAILSFGELVDRLSVVNYKLFTLKDEVMKRNDAVKWVHEGEKMSAEQEVKNFTSWASVEDVKLCKERSRLKTAIDQKLIAMIGKLIAGDASGGHNPEVKKYGDKIDSIPFNPEIS